MNADLGAYTTATKDWGRWGPDDSIGRGNLLDADSVVAASRVIQTGERFSLAIPMGSPGGDPCLPGRATEHHTMVQTAEDYRTGRLAPLAGGMQYADDRIEVACHGTTHMDSLGHAFADDTIWNGVQADSDSQGVHSADIASLARKGVVGRAVLVDLPRHRGVKNLPMRTQIGIAEVEAALIRQRVTLLPGDTLILRTGIFSFFYENGPAAYYADFVEPGLIYEPRTLEFFREHDLAGLGSDTLCNEQAHNESVDATFPLHVLLQRNLGVIFHEALWLDDWADYCDSVGRYVGFYVAAPLHIVGGSGSPMNPIVIM
ncbi:MAG: cyclase family protein [Microbacteriaceae bacterium]|nr:cyclase family protein [Microbacteriaceae bacterium]